MKITERKTDKLFRKYIRKRDNYTCQRCRKEYDPQHCRGLQVSHYWSRSRENTRFDPENCILLCYGCHQFQWGHGDGRQEYTDFMKQKLGEDRFNWLDVRAHTTKKRDDAMDMVVIKELLKELRTNPVGYVEDF